MVPLEDEPQPPPDLPYLDPLEPFDTCDLPPLLPLLSPFPEVEDDKVLEEEVQPPHLP